MPWWGWLLLGTAASFAAYQLYRAATERPRGAFERANPDIPRFLLRSGKFVPLFAMPGPRPRGERGPGLA